MAEPIALRNSAFTVTSLRAGANDAISRLALVYDTMRFFFDIEFYLPAYRNYHAPDFDFFEEFGLYRAFSLAPQVEPSRTQEIRFSEVVAELIDGRNCLANDTAYLIQADLYSNNPLISELRARAGGLPRSFLGRLSYSPEVNPFSADHSDVTRVVVHLRRHDICGEFLFQGVASASVPLKEQKKIHRRKLLTLAMAVRALEQELPADSRIELVVASDGLGFLPRQFGRFEGVKERLDALLAELNAEPMSDLLDIRVVERIIGSGPAETRRTLDAMYCADLVLTASSSFPQLPCRVGNTRLIMVDVSGVESPPFGESAA